MGQPWNSSAPAPALALVVQLVSMSQAGAGVVLRVAGLMRPARSMTLGADEEAHSRPRWSLSLHPSWIGGPGAPAGSGAARPVGPTTMPAGRAHPSTDQQQ
jgi:hypothetical protein